MSHFSVLVTQTDKINTETQLAPFDENMSVPEYVKYTREQLIENERREFEEYRAGTYAEFLADPEAYKAKRPENIRHIHYLEHEFPKRFQWTDEDFYREAIRFYDMEELTPLGGVYSTRNPLSKWDWWTVGGRWSGYLILKSGEHADCAKLADIDWEAMGADGRANAEQRWRKWEEESGEGKDAAYAYFCYGIEKDETREAFIARKSVVSPFAVLHKSEWYEQGEMGWWAMGSNRKSPDDWQKQFQKILSELQPDDEITVVDCHI